MSLRNVFIGVTVLFLILIIIIAYRAQERLDPPHAGPDEMPLVDSMDPAALAAGEPLPASKPDETPETPPIVTETDNPRLPDPIDLSRADRDRDLFGIVVDEVDRPIAGATLEVRWNPEWDIYAGPDHVRPPPVIGPTTRSSGDGTFSLRLAPDAVVDLHTAASGFARVVSLSVNAGEKLKIVLPPPSAIRLEVVDREGEAVAAAEARLNLFGEGAMALRLGDERDGRTDEEGRHLFDQLEAGEGYVNVRHEVHGFSSERFTLPLGETIDLLIVLRGGRLLTGQVRDLETGAPLEGASVGPGHSFGPGVETDAEGRYEIGGVGETSYSQLRARADGYVTRELRVPAEGDLDFELDRGHTGSGRVLDDDGWPISGARVYMSGTTFVRGALQRDGGTTGTDSSGEFTLAGLHPSVRHIIDIGKKGYPRLTLPLDHSKAEEGRIDLGDLILAAPRRIEGRALDSDGAPLRREHVYASRIPSSEELAPAPNDHRVQGLPVIGRWTDDLGRFRLPDLVPGDYVLTLNSNAGGETSLSVTLHPGADLLGVVLQMEGGSSITVRVERVGGEPISGAFITVRGKGFPSRYPSRTDAAGRAVLTGLPEKELNLQVGFQNRTSLILPPRRRVVPRGQEVVFRLEEGVLVKGIVVDEDDEPVSGLIVRVAYAGDSEESLTAFTDLVGGFSLRCRSGESLDLRVSGSNRDVLMGGSSEEDPAFYSGELNGVPVPTGDLEIRVRKLPMDRTVKLRVTNADGEDLAGAFVEVWGSGLNAPESPYRTDEMGRLTLEGLPPSRVRIRIFDPSGKGPGFGDEPDAEKRVVPDGQEVVVVLGGAD